MSPKVFITGATGYIGGDALYEIINAHPDWDITCSVRNSDKGAKVAAIYPQVRLVYGDLDSVSMIEEEVCKADIVYHFANCDHEASALAIARGLTRRVSDSPGFWIHTSGGFILGWETMKENLYGEELPHVYNDWDLVNELTSQPDSAPHRNVDKIVLAASAKDPEKIKTAIVCPPEIWGPGRGPDNQRSVQLNSAIQAFMKHGKAFQVGKGQNIWNQVHIQDLSKLYLLLGEAAAKGGPPATWNDQGYYLAENGSFAWGDIHAAAAKEANRQGFLKSAQVESLSVEEAEKLSKVFRSIGTNSRGEAIRGKKLLGWQSEKRSMMDEIPIVIEGEARTLGLLQGHAAKVTQ